MISQLQVPLHMDTDFTDDICNVVPDLVIDEWIVSAALAVSDGCLHAGEAVQSVISLLGLNGNEFIIERALLSMQLVASCRAMLDNAADPEQNSIETWPLVSICYAQSPSDDEAMTVPSLSLHRAFRSLEIIDPVVCLIAEAAMLGGMAIEEIAIAVDRSCCFVDIQLQYARRLLVESLDNRVEESEPLEETRL